MTDARLPERWLSDRRLLRLPDAAFRLFVTALVWSVSNRTDGRIEPEDLGLLPGVDVRAVPAVVKAGLWRPYPAELPPESSPQGWFMVDFEDTQTTAAQLAGLAYKRAHERESKARRRAHDRGDHSLCRSDTCAIVRGVVRADDRPDT